MGFWIDSLRLRIGNGYFSRVVFCGAGGRGGCVWFYGFAGGGFEGAGFVAVNAVAHEDGDDADVLVLRDYAVIYIFKEGKGRCCAVFA